MVGTIGKDIISFDDMLEMGVKVIFAKDGTDAMDPSLYLTEEESAVIGKWASESVEELLGDGPQTSMEGVDNINDALRLDFKNDRNVTVIYKGEEIDFSKKEYDLLLLLVLNKNLVITREKILDKIWKSNYYTGDRTVDVYISKLRDKLPEISEYIKTIKGVGYKLEEKR